LSLDFFFFNLILLYYDNARLTLVIYFNWFGMRSSRYIEKQICSRLMLDLTKLNSILLIFFTDSFHVIFLSFDCFGYLNFVFQFNLFILDWYKVGRGDLFWLALYAILAVLGKQIRCSVNAWFGKIKFILFDFFRLNPSVANLINELLVKFVIENTIQRKGIKMEKTGKPYGQFEIYIKGHLSSKIYFVYFLIHELRGERRILLKNNKWEGKLLVLETKTNDLGIFILVLFAFLIKLRNFQWSLIRKGWIIIEFFFNGV